MFLPLSTSLREEALALTFSHHSSPVTDHRFSTSKRMLLFSSYYRDLGTIRSRAQALVKSGEWKSKKTREVEIAGIVGG